MSGWANGDICPLSAADRCEGRLVEHDCPVCGGNWAYSSDGERYDDPCPRCDEGSIFVCDACGTEVP